MKKRRKLSQKDLSLLNDLHAAMQEEKHRGMYWVILLLAAFLATAITWSYYSNVNEVTRGQGSVIPTSREQIIQSLDPGIISEMLVKEGDLVEKGQVLLRLDSTRSSAILRESHEKVKNLEAVIARLTAEAHGKKLVFPKHLPDDLVERERSFYTVKKKALEEALKSLTKTKALLDREIRITAPMVAKGAMSEVELLRMKRQSADLQLQLTERKNNYVTTANDELAKAQAELAQAKENMAVRADPVERSYIRSPLKGIVNNIRINTIGGVISAGEDIMEIVPVDDNLLIEAYISTRDVAYVRPGLDAVVKLSAYDYAIYGGLNGKVTLLSPGALRDKKQRPSELNLNPSESYYRVLIKTEGMLTDKNGNILPIIPGMPASVDIKTGEKTIFQYLIKPLTRMKQALQER